MRKRGASTGGARLPATASTASISSTASLPCYCLYCLHRCELLLAASTLYWPLLDLSRYCFFDGFTGLYRRASDSRYCFYCLVRPLLVLRTAVLLPSNYLPLMLLLAASALYCLNELLLHGRSTCGYGSTLLYWGLYLAATGRDWDSTGRPTDSTLLQPIHCFDWTLTDAT
uniref:Uncharacterized protein n=1 Tax=Knipowitschia caucasica TaxID=637954 RepID=A0AAV2IYJ6_KNICA